MFQPRPLLETMVACAQSDELEHNDEVLGLRTSGDDVVWEGVEEGNPTT